MVPDAAGLAKQHQHRMPDAHSNQIGGPAVLICQLTREQCRSELGLAAQRSDIDAFGSREGLAVKTWYQDIQTGAGKDASAQRRGLAAALKEARAARCPLMVETRPTRPEAPLDNVALDSERADRLVKPQLVCRWSIPVGTFDFRN